MVAFLGFGKLASQVIDHFDITENFAVFDSIYCDGNNAFKFEDYLKHARDFSWIVPIGYLHLAKKHSIISNLIDRKAEIKTLIHTTSILSKSSEIMPGSIIYPGCNIDSGVKVSYGSILNNSVIVSHDSTIGECSYVSPGVVIAGNVNIGAKCFIGAGTVISNGISIGENSVIGVGSVITDDVPANSQVIGNPMRFLTKKIKLK